MKPMIGAGVVLGVVLFYWFGMAALGADILDGKEWEISFENTFSSLRKVDREIGDVAGIGKIESLQYMLCVSYGVADWVEFYAGTGVANLEYKDHDRRYMFDEEIAYSVGLKLLVYGNEGPGLKVLVGVEYFRVDNLAVKPNYLEPGDTLDYDWEEWKSFLNLSKRLGAFNPYIGITFADLELSGSYFDASAAVTEKAMLEGHDEIGVVLGTDIYFSKNASATFEIRAVDETAFNFGLKYKF